MTASGLKDDLKTASGATYFQSAKDNYLRCPGTYARFDVYDSTRDVTEARILDNLAKQLSTESTLSGYLIAYAGKEACRNEAKSRLLEAKRYLKEKHNIESPQVTFVDGGFQTDWVVEIWLGSRQSKPPEKTDLEGESS